ncbi:MAG: DUF91 domain-containing protein [Leptospiraceae bacterium]|nr:DUF91 domain-containing protein [Leptospiraceae bacterium]
MLEQELEDFLSINPYLIDPGLDGLRPSRQLSKGKHRLDLLFQKRTVATIVELKRGALDCEAVHQMARYVREFSTEYKLGRTHYLVGQAPSQPEFEAMKRLQDSLPFTIRLRLLGKHIPLQLLFDLETRKYIAYDTDLSKFKNRYPEPKVFRL